MRRARHAADGYRTTFSSAELTRENGPSQVFLVWEEDGHPLDPSGTSAAARSDRQEGRARGERREGIRVVDLGK